MTPMGGYEMLRSYSAEGYQPHPGERMVALSNPVTKKYLATMGIPLLLGRDFQPRDEPAVTPRDDIFAALGRMSGGGNSAEVNSSPICIVNESLARRLFGGASPVGRHLSFDSPYSAESAVEIVGVVKDVHYSGVKTADDTGTGLMRDSKRPGGKRALSAEKVKAVVEATLQTTPTDATHWSLRSMAKAQGLSRMAVQRIWKAHNLQPHPGGDF